jgi:hypothetical protein
MTFAAARVGLKSIKQDVFASSLEQAQRKGYSEDLLAVILWASRRLPATPQASLSRSILIPSNL